MWTPTIRCGRALLPCLIAALLALPCWRSARAQATPEPAAERAQPFGDTVFAAGTSIRDGSGRDWAYVLWQSDRPERLRDAAFAIYRKSGEAGGATPYQRSAIVAAQLDPRALLAVVHLAESLGEDPIELENQINSLFPSVSSGTVLGLGEKLSAVLRAGVDEEKSHTLEFLARAHPAVAMALGQAYALSIPAGKTTFEIREWDPRSQQDGAVIGRVTVTAGEPEVLPPPGPPVVIPDATPQGHLNVRLRWGTTPELNRAALLQHGFNLYRLPAAFVERAQFHLQPPPPQLLRSLLAGTNATQVNRLPIVVEEDFSMEEASNLDPARGGDPRTSFITDNHHRYDAGGEPFANGDRFYYFVAARDLLGRDGELSFGTPVTICDRRPPPLPRSVQVRSDYAYENGRGVQFLRVSWEGVRDPETGTNVLYHLYRWDSPNEVQTSGRVPTNNLIAVLPGDASCPNCPVTYADRGAGAPVSAGKTYWYTVRVEDTSACGGNLSAHTAPVFGVLRDYRGPDDPSGRVLVRCGTPEVLFKNTANLPPDPGETLDPDLANYRLVCRAQDPQLEWVDWYVSFGGPKEFLGRQPFPPGNREAVLRYQFPRLESAKIGSQKFSCQVGSADGKHSTLADCELQGLPKDNLVRHVDFAAEYDLRQVASSEDCAHNPAPKDEGVDLSLVPIDLEYTFPANAGSDGIREWKLYRQVDGQAMSLLAQGTNAPINGVALRFQDHTLPVNDSRLCYFLQIFDEQGNPSRLFPLGCTDVIGTGSLPVPTLAAIGPAGTSLAPQMRLRWFSPPYGVERFELRIEANAPLPHDFGSQLSESGIPAQTGANAGLFRTGRVGGDLAAGPVFSMDVPIALGVTYSVSVRALGPSDRAGEFSNLERFNWRPVPPDGPGVPWPVRGLPAVDEDFNRRIDRDALDGRLLPLGVAALILAPTTNGPSGIAIRIGEAKTSPVPSDKMDVFTPGDSDPIRHVYRSTNGLSLCPFVLYRCQTVNKRFPKVSGDLVQVSPLLEQIAFKRGILNGNPVAFIRDPFVTLLPPNNSVGRYQIVLRDTQPIVAGARYRYFLMHFAANGEPDTVIPTNEVEIPTREGQL